MSSELEIRIVGDRVVVRQGSTTVLEAPLSSLVEALSEADDGAAYWRMHPKDVRLFARRRDAIALAIEIPAQARTVRWLAQGSRVPFGRGAKYQSYFLSFPYLVLLVVLRRGELTGYQQLYYRRHPLDEGGELLLPNLYNVASGHGQRCWVCLQSLGGVGQLAWPEKVAALADHVFGAAFNQSSEAHEGNSYWSSAKAVDPRVATPEAWEAATRNDPWFALEVPWQPAGTTAAAELRSMLDRVVAPLAIRSAADLSSLMLNAGKKGKRGGG